jgi:hypothetical protein
MVSNLAGVDPHAMNSSGQDCKLALSVVPFSARCRAIIFMLRPQIAANTIENMVGPKSMVVFILSPNWLPFVGFLCRVTVAAPRTKGCQ